MAAHAQRSVGGVQIGNAGLNLTKAIIAGGGTIPAAAIQHPFTMVFGGGIDINLTKNIAFGPGKSIMCCPVTATH
jgi:hypothetical protein